MMPAHDGADMRKPERTHTYTDMIGDSARWDEFHPRKGDIIVATPPKCGTTWTQMICALLVHQSPGLPQPLTVLSRWFDRHSEPAKEVAAHFDAQPFRRIVKTHTPLDGLPYWDDATYVFCGRDPRDAFLSLVDHLGNLSPETVAEATRRTNLPPGFRFPTDPDDMFPLWFTHGNQPWLEDGFPAGPLFYLTQTFWDFRGLDNIVFLHYQDLVDDLDGEMRRLSAALGIAVDETRWPGLVQAARFESMRDRASDTAPGAHLGEWADNTSFFRKARSGEWRTGLSAENLALYARLAPRKVTADCLAWLEGGRKAFDPKTP
ncbi:MAG TPA: sulfotransferase domain-containing protein [Rhizomicrobium sp.]|nr:sulfotransferase domain-containing protein [Rhizomicrobium sp.]